MSNPIRQCLVRRTRHEAQTLLRFVKVQDSVVWDSQHKLLGRGAYLQAKVEVIEQARQVKIWRRAFRLSSEQVIDYVNLNKVLDHVLGELQDK